MANNIVAIVGKPNVGKSSLFNKLIGKRLSIVHDQEGVTRDRLYHDVAWTGKNFTIIDTGGIHIQDKPFREQIKLQAEIAIEEAQVILFMVDGLLSLDVNDQFILGLLRKSGKPILLIANKLEGNKQFNYSFYDTGLDIFSISALHGEGIGDVLDEIIKYLDFNVIKENKMDSLSIIGRPNAGKSSLLNSLVGQERAIVSPISGTTRDSVDAICIINEHQFKIIDTAGINKKSKLIESVDHYALLRAMNSLREATISLLLIDSTRELAHFDARVAGYAIENKKPIIIVINKWDLIPRETNTMSNFVKKIRKEWKFLSWAPIVFISAIKKERLNKLKETVTLVQNNLSKKIKTNLLNDVIMDIQLMQPAPSFNGGRLIISFVKQDVNNTIPSFVFFVNNKNFLHFSYGRYIENQLREYFGFVGVPLKLVFKNKRREDE